ncbi:molybdopterin molybdotransferase MoeA [Thiohalobacter sp. IOR34]|uniref:molybdopterin molybdotransferase MoeA n=1 Tax=Thiohalobacter sp. IOR34 TaxID=3057176 RepID=UPI0025B1899E|nr:gephyrin-like molybdotransferase Glp [Thiohalobacter sp. IOR34]WJW74761.1 molybdopterin molybdotransferase MoeA [Thiohalobacter sp. IOR34]
MNDRNDHNPSGLLSVDEARSRIFDMLRPIRGDEQLAIRSALGRVLAEPVISGIDVPPYANSAMDGYALRAADLPAEGTATLKLIGRAMAGAPFEGRVGAGECVRIMTGAKLPDGADTVLMQERVEAEGEQVRINAGHRPGENVRHPGEDMAVGQTVLEPGRRLTPADLGVLASLGIPEVRVRRRLRVAFFSTGDELVSLGQPLGEGQIYDSNRYTLYGMLQRCGAELLDMGVIPDRREAVRRAFQDAMSQADVVITSGGVSVGEADYVKQTLDELGEVHVWRMAMKPGKPLAVGRLGEATFFGLPGNPVSAMATFYQFVQPALERLGGATPGEPLVLKIPTATDLKKSPGRLEYQRGVLARDAHGNWTVTSSGRQGSHVLTSMSRANCFVILPAKSAGAKAGELVDVQPFAGLI